MSSLKQIVRKPLFTIEWCKGCGICVSFCSRGAIAITKEGKAELAYPDQCDSCGICELRCPDLAIQLEEDTHQ